MTRPLRFACLMAASLTLLSAGALAQTPDGVFSGSAVRATDPYGPVNFRYEAPLDPADPSGRTAAIPEDAESGALATVSSPEADAVLLGTRDTDTGSAEKHPANTGRCFSLAR